MIHFDICLFFADETSQKHGMKFPGYLSAILMGFLFDQDVYLQELKPKNRATRLIPQKATAAAVVDSQTTICLSQGQFFWDQPEWERALLATGIVRWTSFFPEAAHLDNKRIETMI